MLKTSIRTDERSGVVLLVVIAMLSLFATVALSFVFYAEAEATNSRYASLANTQPHGDVDPEMLLSYFLSQLIYDTDNPHSAMRGHSLARNMYGLHPDTRFTNNVPFNGIGRMRLEFTHPSPLMAGQKKNNALLINYTDFSKGGLPVDNVVLRDPEKDPTGKFVVAGNVHWTYPDLNNMFLAAVNASGEVLTPSFHRPWLNVNFTPPAALTDPWAKYMTLRPHPSYHPQFFTPDSDAGGDVKNLEWGPGTRIPPLPANPNGPPSYANNDSIWMDLGFPVQTAPNGKHYKALFAPLIVDLDNKLNLYAHGNMTANVPISGITHTAGIVQVTTAFSHGLSVGQTVTISGVAGVPVTVIGYNGDFIVTSVTSATTFTYLLAGALPPFAPGPGVTPFATSHASNQGWGAWEVNLSKLLNRGGAGVISELSHLMRAPFIGRNGPNGMQDGGWSTPLNNRVTTPPFYSSIDYGDLPGFDGTNSKYMYYSGDTNDPKYPLNKIRPFPSFASNWDNAAFNEINNHPSRYNPFGTSFSGIRRIVSATAHAASATASIVTITTDSAHGFRVGQTVTVASVAVAGYNGDWIITSIPSVNSFTYTAGGGLVSPALPAGGFTSDVKTAILSATQAASPSTIVTITTFSTHGFRVGQTVSVAGVTVPGYDGTSWVITSVPSANSFTYAAAATSLLAAPTGGHASDERTAIFRAVQLGTNVTITTVSPHGFAPGQTVTVMGVGAFGPFGPPMTSALRYNGNVTITSTPTPTTFTYTAAVGLAPSAGGVAIDDKVALVTSQLEALYRYQGTGSPALTTDLFALLPNNMRNARARWLTTLRSMDLDRPGLVPFRTSSSNYKVVSPATIPVTRSTVGATNGATNFPTSVPFGGDGEFDGNGWRSQGYSTVLRLLLNRKLQPYPAPDLVTGLLPPGSEAAPNLDRTNMASDLYTMLRLLTGANPAGAGGAEELAGARLLAQLAVNIVDFIDDDDYNTAWNAWHTTGEYVYGTELPQLLLNEVYASVDTVPADTVNYKVNFWVELHNPVTSIANIVGASQAGTTVTIDTDIAHRLTVGQTMSISGVDTALVRGYNGTFVVSAVLLPTKFQYVATIAGLPAMAGGTVNAAFPRDGSGRVFLKAQGTALGSKQFIR